MLLLFLLFPLGLLTVTVFPLLLIGLFELLVFVSLSLFVFVTGVLFPVFVDVIVGLFVFVVVVVTSDVAAANVKWLKDNKYILPKKYIAMVVTHAIEEVETVVPIWFWVEIR